MLSSKKIPFVPAKIKKKSIILSNRRMIEMAPEVISLGELLIDFVSLDRDVSLVESTGFKKAPGGAPANVAVGVARLGRTSSFIGKVGTDPFGHYLKQVLDDCSVDTSHLVFDDYARTTLSFVAQKADGVRDCMFYRNPGADMLLKPEEISEEYISQAKIFHFGSISLGSEDAKAATLKALEYAKKHKLLISYDPNLRLTLWDDLDLAKKEINSGFEHADIVKISEEEFEFITGCKTIEECTEYILNMGPQLVIVTLGGEGCFYSDGKNGGYVKGFEVDVLETTGAGDAFVAYVLSNLLDKIDKTQPIQLQVDDEFVQILTMANGAGALATTKLGAIPSLPTNAEIKEFTGSQK
jgi:fructokinase